MDYLPNHNLASLKNQKGNAFFINSTSFFLSLKISCKGSVNITEDEKVIEEDINPFHAAGLFLHPSKTSENQRFSDVFRGYRKKPVA